MVPHVVPFSSTEVTCGSMQPASGESAGQPPRKESGLPNYSMRVEWSPEDEVYLASCPELGDLYAHGATPQEAVVELSEAAQLAIDTYEEEGLEDG